jgi:hypothetical protein
MLFINNVRLADRYVCAILYSMIMFSLLVVDLLLLRRLKTLYPSFYAKERGKILFSNISLILALLLRIVANYVFTLKSYQKILQESIVDQTYIL